MKVLIIAELFILFALLAFEICDSILGADPVDASDFPFVVKIVSRQNARHICAGSLITKQHVLTAAHCVLGNNKNKIVMIRLPHAELSFDIDHVELEDPNQKNLCNNLAIVKLKRPTPDSPSSNTIAVSSEEFLHSLCAVSGFGWINSESDSPPYSLKELHITAQPIGECQSDVKSKLKDGQFCTFGSEYTGFHMYDMGGPIIVNSTLVGVVSGCNMEEDDEDVEYIHDIHVGLHEHLDFIRAKTDKTLQLRAVECGWDKDSTLPF